MNFEDNYSKQAGEYARYRPHYPDELFVYLASIAPSRRLAWDCGTGSGQAARQLVDHFNRVTATDASAEQIAHAFAHERIEYRVERVEEVSLEPASVDLVTVAVAVHWFDLPRFYETVRRVAVADGVLAVWTYHLPVIEPSIDRVMSRYFSDVLAGYWPEGIQYVDDRYRTLPFPFEELEPPRFETRAEWDLAQLAGFLDSWSGTQRYLASRGQHPLRLLWPELLEAWGDSGHRRTIRWPLYLRVGRIS